MLPAIFRTVFIFELMVNGTFLLATALLELKKLPESWNYELIRYGLDIAGGLLIPLVILTTIFANYFRYKRFSTFLRGHVFSLVIFVPMLLTRDDLRFTFWLAASHLLASILSLYEKPISSKYNKQKLLDKNGNSFFTKLKFKPAQVILMSFCGLILAGSFLLMLPFSSKSGEAMNFVDAIFMATSATCVTGLTTVSVTDTFSLFGQIVILILIQIGGLGYMTLSSSIAILLGRSMAMKDRILMQDLLDVSSQEELLGMIIDIIKYTFLIELWGGIILTIGFTLEGFEFSKAIYFGFFHSISAFCNAGFSLFTDSLESFSTRPLIHLTICVLIILGGLGFVVLKELREAIIQRKSFVRFGLHTKVVLITTFGLVAGGTLFIFFGEFLHALDHYTLWEKIQISFFQSVTLRTAGFNTIPLTSLHTYTIFVMTLFMFIGAGSGSTAGGIKISTFAILIQSVTSTLKGRGSVEFFDRKVPQSVVVKAIALIIISVVTVCIFIMILMRLEPQQNFLAIFFEVISASGTVGLSLGLTPYLSVAGKLAISLLMFIGRTGPLTLILAIGQKDAASGKIDYPQGRVMIG